MNKERLLKLADHLEFGVLGHSIFDFSYLNLGKVNPKNLCATNGCAIGECPIAFPEDWEFRQIWQGTEPLPILKGIKLDIDSNASLAFKSAQEFFDLTIGESDILFLPSDWQNKDDRNDEDIGDVTDSEGLIIKGKRIERQFYNVTKEEIAKHIRYFVELKEL
jgi:hypothetical protein